MTPRKFARQMKHEYGEVVWILRWIFLIFNGTMIFDNPTMYLLFRSAWLPKAVSYAGFGEHDFDFLVKSA
jgi:hypothetical protein